MTTRRFWFSAFALALVLFGAQANTACGFNVAPVYDVDQAAVVTASGEPATDQSVRSAIVRALAAKHWTVLSDQPGTITASVSSAGNSATIRIDYSATNYSIHHEASSPGMKYDGVKIHRHYNTWIKFLNDTIVKMLVEPATSGEALPAEPAPVDPGEAAAAPAQ